jgi:hypothetical protein
VTFAEIEEAPSSSRGEWRRFGLGAPPLEEIEEIATPLHKFLAFE